MVVQASSSAPRRCALTFELSSAITEATASVGWSADMDRSSVRAGESEDHGSCLLPYKGYIKVHTQLTLLHYCGYSTVVPSCHALTLLVHIG